MRSNLRRRVQGVFAAASVAAFGLIATPSAPPAHAAGTAKVSVGDAQILEGDAPATRVMSFALTLDQIAAGDVVVNWMLLPDSATPADFKDFGGAMKKTTIRAGKVSQFINVSVYADTIPESNHTFQVHLMNAANASLDDHMGTGTIIDDDPVGGLGVAVGDTSIAEGNQLDRKVKVWVTLTSPAPSTVTVRAQLMAMDASAGTDYVDWTAPKTLTFNAGQMKKALSLTVHPDPDSEGNEQFHVMLDNPVGVTILNDIGMVTINDDDSMFPLTTQTFTIGPFTLTPAGTVGFENAGFGSAPRPSGVVGIKNMRFDLVDGTGAHLDHHSVHFHHVVLLDQGRNDSLCPSLGYNRFSGAGKERQPMQLPDEYVYQTHPSAAWAASWHLMNMSTTTKTVYIEYEVDYVSGADLASTKNVNTYFYDVDNCWGDSEFVVPGTGGPGSIFTKSINYTVPRNGLRVAAGGHIHDGGIDISTKRTASGQVLCTATGLYDSMNMLTAVTPCTSQDAVTAGEQLTVTTRYENDAMIDDAMGIQLTYVYEP